MSLACSSINFPVISWLLLKELLGVNSCIAPWGIGYFIGTVQNSATVTGTPPSGPPVTSPPSNVSVPLTEMAPPMPPMPPAPQGSLAYTGATLAALPLGLVGLLAGILLLIGTVRRRRS
ncbi:hypothetical protein FHU41_002220 [Psychromicrobium silvestre]|uniref:Gram-positive cocci surface proteins LPxTG domain-containing protein n=1 Tax=Psychromicrobium silvestre TaxID=1645614 RepID=A0A7Y9LUV8_9MICC|nr:hypothetical protein [Psychromicrobium silvestre]NYE95970.1 hypothetical protein [Psychromicrobium silvestre]